MIGKIEISIRAQAERAGAREEKAAFGAMTLSHHPHGVLGVFGPFNFPGHLPNGHIVPALLMGNTVVLKPSDKTPAVGQLLGELFQEALAAEGFGGLGVVNVVQGGAEVASAPVSHGDVDGCPWVLRIQCLPWRS